MLYSFTKHLLTPFIAKYHRKQQLRPDYKSNSICHVWLLGRKWNVNNIRRDTRLVFLFPNWILVRHISILRLVYYKYQVKINVPKKYFFFLWISPICRSILNFDVHGSWAPLDPHGPPKSSWAPVRRTDCTPLSWGLATPTHS